MEGSSHLREVRLPAEARLGVAGGYVCPRPGATRVAVATAARCLAEAVENSLAGAGFTSLETRIASGEAEWARLPEYRPDVIVADTHATASPAVQHMAAEAALIVIAVTPPDNELHEHLRALGARALIGTEARLSEVACVLRAVSFDSRLSGLAAPYRDDRATALGKDELSSGLTRRQREIAHLLEDGRSNKEIAAELSIELSTVKNHVHRILECLAVTRRSQVKSEQLIPHNSSKT